MLFKKAISPVVATALLLVVSVIAVVGFQNWFTNFSSSQLTDIEEQTATKNKLSIETVVNNNLYINSNSVSEFKSIQINDETGSNICTFKKENNTFTGFAADTNLLINFDNQTTNQTHIKDLSGYNNDFWNFNNSNYTNSNCLSGHCFEFDGKGQNLLSKTENAMIFKNNSQFTISIWFKTTDKKNRQFLIRKDGGDGNRRVISMAIFQNYSQLEFCGQGCSTYIELNANQTTAKYLTDGNYHNMIAIKNKDNAKLYIDGVLEYDFTNETLINGDFSNIHNISIGNSPRNFYQNQGFNGTIDEISIYSKAITYQEIQLLYNAKIAMQYEQLIQKGIKKIDLTSCNLEKNKKYTVITTTNDKILEKDFVSK